MKAKITLNTFTVCKGTDKISFNGGTVEVEYAVGELTSILKVKTEMIPVAKDFLTGMVKEVTPFFNKFADLEEKRHNDIHAIEVRRMEIEEAEFKASTLRQDAESAARVNEIEAQTEERKTRTKIMKLGK